MIDYYRQRTHIPDALPSVSYSKTYQLPEGSQVTVALKIIPETKKSPDAPAADCRMIQPGYL